MLEYGRKLRNKIHLLLATRCNYLYVLDVIWACFCLISPGIRHIQSVANCTSKGKLIVFLNVRKYSNKYLTNQINIYCTYYIILWIAACKSVDVSDIELVTTPKCLLLSAFLWGGRISHTWNCCNHTTCPCV